jgi:hypothetical protein
VLPNRRIDSRRCSPTKQPVTDFTRRCAG